MTVVVVGLAFFPAAADERDAWIVPGKAGVVVDWTRGVIIAHGAGAPDPRAPLGGIARVGAERTAERAARQKLERAVRALIVAGGKSVGELAQPHSAQRIADVIDRARRRNVRYASDGSTELSLVLPLEAVRTALAPLPRPQADATAPTAIVVDARGHNITPVLAIKLMVGNVTWAGPTIWHRSHRAAQKDVRAGGRVVRASVRSYTGHALVIELDKKSLARAQRAGTLVMIVTGEKTP